MPDTFSYGLNPLTGAPRSEVLPTTELTVVAKKLTTATLGNLIANRFAASSKRPWNPLNKRELFSLHPGVSGSS
jgi:hypothetical protein